jgi:hypothetical protein
MLRPIRGDQVRRIVLPKRLVPLQTSMGRSGQLSEANQSNLWVQNLKICWMRDIRRPSSIRL